MKTKILFILTFLPLISFSQKLNRNVFKYEKLKTENFAECDENLLKELESSLIEIEENNSALALKIAKDIYKSHNDCYHVFDVYGYALFRSGEWFDGIDIIEKGIKKFGSVPELIKRKAQMSLEMAQLGTSQKNIDGNSVYKKSSAKYDEDQFVEENFKSALVDLEYLMKKYKQGEETYYVAKIYQILKNYDKSTEIFKTLLNDEEYKNSTRFNIADNYLAQNKLTEAEAELKKLLEYKPKEGPIYEKLAEIYKQKNDKINTTEYNNKAVFYNNVPEFSNIEYSKDNFDLLILFGTEDKKSDEKIKKLNEIYQQKQQEYTIDICLIILKIHANHGNGVEEKATEILAKIGKPSIEKVNKLFQSDVSTCTISNLAKIMATVKDENSWELMKQYLPYIANMPMTLIPPSLPEKMIQFDETRGITEILIAVKPLLSQTKKSDNPLDELSGFGQYVYYSPLKNVNRDKLKKIATELKYSDQEFMLLEEKIK